MLETYAIEFCFTQAGKYRSRKNTGGKKMQQNYVFCFISYLLTMILAANLASIYIRRNQVSGKPV